MRWADRRHLGAAYIALLLASWLVQKGIGPAGSTPEGAARSWTLVDRQAREGAIPSGRPVAISSLEWGEGAGRPVVILLHGSPGRAGDFARMGPELAERGYHAIALDMPGFARSSPRVPDYSIGAYARYVLAFMDEREIASAHLVGWSNGGGTALWMADLSPVRASTLTLIGSIGVQEAEGSGSYWFEHAKYAMGFAGVVLLPELVPHFGLLGPAKDRHAFIRNFWDTDQRALRRVMEGVRTPTLILHGRDDFLVPLRAAEASHGLIGPSRLVVMDASHFLPFLQPAETVAEIDALAGSVGAGTFARERVDLVAPRPNPLGRFGRAVEGWIGERSWWVALVLLGLLAMVAPSWALVVGGYLAWRIRLDPGVVVAGLWMGHIGESMALWFIGRALGKGRAIPMAILDFVGPRHESYWEQRMRTQRGLRLTAFVTRFQPWARRAAALAAGCNGRGRASTVAILVGGGFVWALGGFIAAVTALGLLAPLGGSLLGWAGVIAAGLAALAACRVGELLATWVGRRRLLAMLSRARRFEFWPATIAYAPLVPWLLWLAGRHRSPLAFSCANPGIAGGGGIVGESKKEILAALAGSGTGEAFILPAAFIPAGGTPRQRADRARREVAERSDLGGYPVICKPDAAQRGFAVRLVRRPEEFESCFTHQSRDAIVQRFHPGPMECGLMWVRDERAGPGRAGRIFSVTRKDFPVIVGDGRSTLEELVYRHRRFRCQADVFLQRFADRRLDVLSDGEELRLSQSGNHCQGTLFRDGTDLITPALEDRIDAIASGFRGLGGGGLDFGRFDLRYESDEKLRAGEGFAIVELNGTTGESTNIYDPDRSPLWAYGVLMRQWAVMYAVGSARRRAGSRALSIPELLRMIRRYYRDRPGSAISD